MSKSLTVLQLFINNPEEYYSVRDVSRLCKVKWITASKQIQEIINKTSLIEEDQKVVVGWRRFKLCRKR